MRDLLVMAALALGVALVGCGGEDQKEPEGPAESPYSTDPCGCGCGPIDEAGDMADDAAEEAEDAAAAAVQQAESLLERARTAIGEQNWDTAEKLLGELEGLQDMLPESWKDKIADLKRTLQAKKAAEGMGIR